MGHKSIKVKQWNCRDVQDALFTNTSRDIIEEIERDKSQIEILLSPEPWSIKCYRLFIELCFYLILMNIQNVIKGLSGIVDRLTKHVVCHVLPWALVREVRAAMGVSARGAC